MNNITIILLIILSILFILILFGRRQWLTKKIRSTVPGGSTNGQLTKKLWNDSTRPIIIKLLIIIGLTMLFWSEVKNLTNELPMIAIGLTFLILATLIPLKTPQRWQSAASIMLIVLTIIFLAWPATKRIFPDFFTSDQTTHRQTQAPTTLPRLPANAVFVKTLVPGERLYLTRGRMDIAPPKLLAEFNSRYIEVFGGNWPQNDPLYLATNKTTQNYTLYTVGQSCTASTTDPRSPETSESESLTAQPTAPTSKPTPVKTVTQKKSAPTAQPARQSTNTSNTKNPECLLDKAFGPKK